MSNCRATLLRTLDALAAVIIFSLGLPSAAYAQCAPLRAGQDGLPAHNQPLLPESAYLSDATYTNTFFGFAFDLPIVARGHMIRLPLMPSGQHALLAIGYQNGDRSGSFTIDAIELRDSPAEFAASQPQQRLSTRPAAAGQSGPQVEPPDQPQIGPQGTLIAPQPQIGPPQFQPPPADGFHLTMHHSGEKYTAVYWAQIKNYKVGVLVATNDKDFLQKSRRAMAAVRFYCTADNGMLATKDGELVVPAGETYEGPTVATWRAEAAIQKKPGLEIPPGEVHEDIYRNTALGLQYELPGECEVLSAHSGGNPSADLASLREYEFLHACSRILLRLRQRASGGAAGSEHSPMIILRALDPACLSMQLPTTTNDTRLAEEVGVSLEALSEFGQVASQELVSTANRLFMVFRGTITAPTGDGQLTQRMSQIMFVTSQHKLLLVWSFLAPTSEELAAMPAGGIRFNGAAPIELPTGQAAKR